MSLQAKLDAFKADFEAGKPPYNVPRSVIEIMHRATDDLRASGILDGVIKVGEPLPLFALKNAFGQEMRSSELLAKGPLVLTVFRGSW